MLDPAQLPRHGGDAHMYSGVGECLANRLEGVSQRAQALDLVVECERLAGQSSWRIRGQQRGHGARDEQFAG